jgi:FHS family L-fucose permease-like MFS transporter
MRVFELGYTGGALVQFVFFSAYFLFSLPSGRLLASVGYQRGIVLGLALAGVGALLFYPAASLLSYPFFLAGLFVLAAGITLLQVAANPYVAVLGPPETASSRLNLTQAFNSLGTTVAPFLGGLLILSHGAAPTKQMEADAVRMPYLGLAVVLFALAVVMRLYPLPALAGAQGETTGSFRDALRVRHLRLAMLGIFVYVGAEVTIGSFLVNFLALPRISALSGEAAARYVSYYWGAAMIGRFIGSGLLRKWKAGSMLAASAAAAALLVSVAVLTSDGIAMWSLISVGLFNSIMFPTIFTLGIDGLGPLTSRGSSLLVMAIVGGAIVPLVIGAIADLVGLQGAFAPLLLCYLYILYYGARGSRRPAVA